MSRSAITKTTGPGPTTTTRTPDGSQERCSPRIIDWRDSEGAFLGSITLNRADGENAYADLAVTSDADGKVTILADGQDFNFWVNGIEVLPEPGSLLLMIPCAVGFLRRRRAR